jgi:hypothetical protein
MKNSLRTYVSALLLSGAMIGLNSCSKDDEEPANVINDADGIEVVLEWSTGGTDAQAIDDADLDLKLVYDGVQIASSNSTSAFEDLNDFDFSAFDDGEFTVQVRYYGAYTTDDVTYTVTVGGVSVTKTFSVDGSFADEDEGDLVDVIEITKAGNKYTLDDLN